MDDTTKTTLDDFIVFLQKEMASSKEYRHIQLGKWSLKDFKVTVEVFIEGRQDKIYFDVREIKENKFHFSHLLNSAYDQLLQLS